MNPDIPQSMPEELEIRLTALLLGELSPAEAAELRRMIAANPALGRWHDQLQQTIGLVTEAVARPDGDESVATGDPRFSEPRRHALLEKLRTKTLAPEPKIVPWPVPGRVGWPWFIPMSAAAALLLLLAVNGLGRRQREQAEAVDGRVSTSLGVHGLALLNSPAPAVGDQLSGAAVESEAMPAAPRDSLAPMPVNAAEKFHFYSSALADKDSRSRGLVENRLSESKQETRGEDETRVTKLGRAENGFGRNEGLSYAATPLAATKDRKVFRYELAPAQAPAPQGVGLEAGIVVGQPVVTALSPVTAPIAGGIPSPKYATKDAPEEKPSLNPDSAIAATAVGAISSPSTAIKVAPPAKPVEKFANLNREPESLSRRELSVASDGYADGRGGLPGAAGPATSLGRKFGFGGFGGFGGGGGGGRAGGAVAFGESKSVDLNRLSDLGSATDESRRKTAFLDSVAKEKKISAPAREVTLLLAKAEPAAALPELSEALIQTNATVPMPQSEVAVSENAISTFSLNVSDVSFKLAAASLEQGRRPDPASIRSEEFINAFNYRDPEAGPGTPIAFAWDRAVYPFAHHREILRFSLRTAARGREPSRPLNLVLLLDNSGSMERPDRVATVREALRTLSAQVAAQDRISVVTFARTPRLWVDGLTGDQSGSLVERVGRLTPEGGTNLEEAMNLAYDTAQRHFLATGVNRVVLLTDGAANLGEVNPQVLMRKVEAWRQRGVALDCFGIGWDGLNDDLLESLARHGDGRYGLVNSPAEAAGNFAAQLAGALQVAASDVKVQVEFNSQRVAAWRQVGYARHQLTAAQFRDNSVDAAELAAAETGNGIYVIEVLPAGTGPLATVRARYRDPETGTYREHAWTVPFNGAATALEQAPAAMRLAVTASAFSEWLSASPHATEVTPARLLNCLSGVPQTFAPDPTPQKLEWMIRQAQSLSGK